MNTKILKQTLAVAAAAAALAQMPQIAIGATLDLKVANGRIMISRDQGMWTEQRLPINTFPRYAVCANGLWVVVGGSYTAESAVILTSRDGSTFVRREVPAKSNLYGVAFGNGLFVAVGDQGVILTSKDAIHWRQRTRGDEDFLLTSVTYGDGKFVVVGDFGAVLVSTNGKSWAPAKSDNSSQFLSKVLYRDYGYVAMSGNANLLISSDGVRWQRLASTPNEEALRLSTNPLDASPNR